ncbi:ABC transporter ATP-binding protein [Paenibacillus wynnii]|uniref:Macrolide ABC transporter ATP-binding protein n=1 Tax=Paenibacillus wynnii TaxID=268407 RepID=A0A098MDZ9_9BACL|nr:ABC transporter ATP-binding protein [Paenibacillus wynnii]KGE19787.1 macrolide ABC transporter ATP-binding protein [Paenibacillus wynnii]
MIRIMDLHKTFVDGEGENRILQGINLTIHDHEFTTIMGPSGCGKSTLLNIAALLTEPTSGSVYFDDQLVNFKKEKSLEQLRRNKIGLIFQNANLINCLTVLENVILPMNSGLSNKVKKSTALELLDMVGISNKSKNNVKSLSGGEAQRVAIVRALVNNPKVLLCDEPTGALDSDNSSKVMELLLETRKRTQCALVIVTHDKEIGNLGERKIVLRGGEILGVENDFQAV